MFLVVLFHLQNRLSALCIILLLSPSARTGLSLSDSVSLAAQGKGGGDLEAWENRFASRNALGRDALIACRSDNDPLGDKALQRRCVS